MSSPTPTVNLLPWRSQLRRQRCRTFNALLLALLVMAVLMNVGLVGAIGHHTQTLEGVNEGLNQQLDQVLGERDRLTDALTELEPSQHWLESGRWLELLASTTPDRLRWRALQWDRSNDQWRLHFEAAELAVVAPWASDWQADIQVFEQPDEGVIEGVMAGRLSTLSTIFREQDNALVD